MGRGSIPSALLVAHRSRPRVHRGCRSTRRAPPGEIMGFGPPQAAGLEPQRSVSSVIVATLLRCIQRRVVMIRDQTGGRSQLGRLLRIERGQGLVEYALILALVILVVIGVLILLGPAIGNAFSNIKNSI